MDTKTHRKTLDRLFGDAAKNAKGAAKGAGRLTINRIDVLRCELRAADLVNRGTGTKRGTGTTIVRAARAAAEAAESGIFTSYLTGKPLSDATFAQFLTPIAIAAEHATGDSLKAYKAVVARIVKGTQIAPDAALRGWLDAAAVNGKGKPCTPDADALAAAIDDTPEDKPAELTPAAKRKAKREKAHAALVKAIGAYCYPDADAVNLMESFKATEKDRVAVAWHINDALQTLITDRAARANADTQPAAR